MAHEICTVATTMAFLCVTTAMGIREIGCDEPLSNITSLAARITLIEDRLRVLGPEGRWCSETTPLSELYWHALLESVARGEEGTRRSDLA